MSLYRGPKGIRFIGSKGKCGEIARIVNDLMPPNGTYWEPFVGAGKIMQGVRAAHRYGSDIDCHIIDLLTSIQRGWEPPSRVSEDDYKYWKKACRQGARDPLIGFIGYACSFGGRFFEGYARSKQADVNFAASARRSLLRQKPFLQDVLWWRGDYSNYRDEQLVDRPDLIYMDPPYAGTKPCGSVKTQFDSTAFWKWATQKAKHSIVLVSEYTCPVKHAVVVWEKSVSAGIRFGTGGDGGAKGSGKRKLEKLFLLNPNVADKVGFGI